MSNVLKEKEVFNSSVKAITPEGIEFFLSPVGLPVRTFAYAIDKSIQWIIIITFYIATLILLRDTLGVWITLLVFFCIDWFYHVIFELSFRGQTPGKRLMGIRVVKNNGAPIDPSSSFLRNLLRFADTFFFFFPICLISIASSKGFRRLGDWAGGTLVVYTQIEKKKRTNTLNLFIEKYKPIVPLKPLANDEKQAVLNFARRYPLLGEARANEIATEYARYIDAQYLDAQYFANNSDTTNAAFLLGIARKLSGEIK